MCRFWSKDVIFYTIVKILVYIFYKKNILIIANFFTGVQIFLQLIKCTNFDKIDKMCKFCIELLIFVECMQV